MKWIKVEQRKLSPGEIRENKDRRASYLASRAGKSKDNSQYHLRPKIRPVVPE